ncbi:MAG: citrate/2-methylcitrate synthase [Candidatus Woesearchaeota archaeon]
MMENQEVMNNNEKINDNILESYELFNEDSTTFFYNLKGKPIQHMLDFDFLSKRKPSVVAIIHPGRKGFHKCFFGNKQILIPIYSEIRVAIEKHPSTDVMINFASFRSAYDSSRQALETDSIKKVIIVAEGIPERQTKELIALAKQKGKTIIGPATVGGIVAGKFRIGHAGGTNDNIIKANLYRTGSIGLVSRSGGMMNEFFNIISRTTDGIYEGIAIGGDQFPGSTILEHLLRYEANPHIKLIVTLGEVGGTAEYEIIEAKKSGKLTKPIIMWVSGTCANIFPFEVQFGHAGAKAGSEKESAQEKNKALREAEIIVPESFEKFEETISETFKTLVDSGEIIVKEDILHQHIPVRQETHFTSTISDERGKEPTYAKIPLSQLVGNNAGIGEVIGLLWFKKKLPNYFTKFLELSIILTADHGPAVSGAHNAIVASRAGKDIISSLCSGLLTIGPRFGGAIDSASQYFRTAVLTKKEPVDFVKEMKLKGINIPGIGHRVKSSKNPDKRVTILKEFAHNNFSKLEYLSYALEVEKVTLQKADSLILNVDGCIAVLFLDALNCAGFSKEEIDEIVEIGYMNGLFALARSIGMIGHILDQKRLKEPLYRHPVNDVFYVEE